MTNRENKRSLRQKIQDFMSTPKGQTIMNYAYNWGASVVIMGTLFKLTHLPGANFMLFAGMGTEVLIFFLSAFDLSGVKRDGTNAGASVSLGGNIPEILCPVMLLPIIRNFPECRLRMMYLPEIGLQGEALRL